MKSQWLYKVSTAFLIVMLAAAALPVTSAYAAVSRPTDWTSVGSARGTGATLNVAGTYAAAAGTQRYTLLAVFVVNTGGNITPTVSGNWGGGGFFQCWGWNQLHWTIWQRNQTRRLHVWV